jgi:EmrB/QacA subfamily drug resistance transporter
MRSLKSALERVDYKYLVAAAFVFGLFMDILDTTIVNVALPRLSEEFNASTAQLAGVVTGYLVSLAVWIPASGWVGDRFGTKRTFLFATAVFVLGSALCGRAWSIESLTMFRVLQGVGGGMLTPVGTAMLYRAFTPQERARASAILSIPTMIAPMLGPVVGGILVDSLSWRWIFYVNVPVGVASFVFSWLVLKEHKEPGVGRFDPLGFVLSGAGLAGILFALSRGTEDGWTSPTVLASGLGGLVCVGLLVVVESRVAAPMLEFALYARRMFRTASLTAFMFFSSSWGLVFLLPLFLQQLLGLSATESGLTTFAQPIGQIAMVQVTSRLYSRIGPRKNLIIASSGLMTTSLLFLLVGLETNLWWIRGLMLLRGMFMAFNMVAMQTAAFSAVPRAKMGRASSLFSTLRQVGAAFGVAVAGTVLTSRIAALVPAGADLSGAAASDAGLTAFHDAVAVIALLGFLGLVFALQVRDSDVQPARRGGTAAEPRRAAPAFARAESNAGAAD